MVPEFNGCKYNCNMLWDNKVIKKKFKEITSERVTNTPERRYSSHTFRYGYLVTT